MAATSRIAGNYQETLSTLWFHDHRVDHTAENVYKGMVGMMNVYSGIDRGREGQILRLYRSHQLS